MPIPDYQTFMLPLLQCCSDEHTHRMRDVTCTLSDQFELSEEERTALLPSGKQTIVANRVGWAKTYLSKAGLLQTPKRGYAALTTEGKKVLASPPEKIDKAFLEQYKTFQTFVTQKNIPLPKKPVAHPSPIPEYALNETPEEMIQEGYKQIRSALAEELLEKIKGISAASFERLVVELLVAMGYGGNLEDAGQQLGKSGDEGIDGVIKEDRLGLDVIYIQAKRWKDTTVGRPEIQKFVGALQGKRARKGVFITASTYSKEAIEYAAHIDTRVILIDGEKLAHLMMDSGLGVSTSAVYELKQLDTDYFEEE